MVQKTLGWVIACLFVVLSSIAQAQQAKVVKLGEIVFGDRPASSRGVGAEFLRQELRQLGYVEGKNIIFETRSADGKVDRFPALANELVRLKVDVLLASSSAEAVAFKNATKTIPIVYMGPGDLVASGLIDSLARPGGNITGFTEIGAVLAGKRLELLKETIPKLARVAVMWSAQSPNSENLWKESLLAARELGLQLHSMEISSVDNLDTAFKGAIKDRVAALSVTQSPFASFNIKNIVELTKKNRLPAIYQRRDFVENGGLMSYGADRSEPYKRAAVIVDKILKGTKPANIPVEQPMKFEFAINLKTANALGLPIPPIVLMRATRVIK